MSTTCTQLPPRIVGSIAQDTPLYLEINGSAVDGTTYTSWQIECAERSAPGTVLWTKTTGFTSGNGSTAATVSVAWTTSDLGTSTMTAGTDYLLELTGTINSKADKWLFALPLVTGVG